LKNILQNLIEEAGLCSQIDFNLIILIEELNLDLERERERI